MLQSNRKRARRQQLLSRNPQCYFCGGQNASTTIDHVPPKACFPRTHFPEDLEFAACEACNKGMSQDDLVFALYTNLGDFDTAKISSSLDRDHINVLQNGILNNAPRTFPDLRTSAASYSFGPKLAPFPTAVTVEIPEPAKEAIRRVCVKITHAFYQRESGRILSTNHLLYTGSYQSQMSGTQVLTDYFKTLLPDTFVGLRKNIKNYGQRFAYLSGYKDEEDFFVYAAQFGLSWIVWGIAHGPDTLKEVVSGPLCQMRSAAASGPGARSPVEQSF